MATGATAITVEVQGADGKSVPFPVNTDEETVGAALLKLGVIAGEDSDYGLYVKTVNGETADYEKDGAYWAFYVNGEYAMTGVDYTAPEAGTTYGFHVEKAEGCQAKKETAQPSLFFIAFPAPVPHHPAGTGSRSRRMRRQAACFPAAVPRPAGYRRRPSPACRIAAGRRPALRHPAHGG